MNGVSQSAASQLLSQLEDRLGTALLDRTNRPIKLTAAGKLYFEACRDIVWRYDEAASEIGALRKELVGVVRVASIYSIGLYEMALLKEQFEERHPQTTVHLEYMRPEKVYRAVLHDAADLGLVSYPNPGKELRAIPWRLEKMVLVCHPNHPLGSKPTILPSDLANEEFVSFDSDLSIRKAMDRFFRDHAISRRVVLEFDNIQMIKEAVSIGSGVSILPERTVRHEAAEGRLLTRPIKADGLLRPLGVIHHRRKKFSLTGAQFLNFLKQQPHE